MSSNHQPIRWLHLSDFHCGKDHYGQRKLFERIVEHADAFSRKDGAPDIVFITGDIANRGKQTEYNLFVDELLLPLCDVLPASTQIFAVPGNHDVDREEFSAFSRSEILKPGSSFFDPTPQALRARKALFPRFEAYVEFDKNTQAPTNWLCSSKAAYAKIITVANQQIGIVGINTAWLARGDDDRHQLSPGVENLADALQEVRNCSVRIVLGHHPLSWYEDHTAKQVDTMLGQHHALYLCGHLHKASGEAVDGAGHGYLAIQAGASFQTRDNEEWVNGLLWGELDSTEQKLRLQPRRWCSQNRDWPIATAMMPEVRRVGDWWVFELPRAAPPPPPAKSAAVTPAHERSSIPVPDGWELVDSDFLDERRKTISEDDAVHYFDGSIPTWTIILSPASPRRAVVGRVADLIQSHHGQTRPLFVNVLGPGGEGKSTVLMHTIATVVERDPQVRVLWRHNRVERLTPEAVLALPTGDHSWLLASDEGETIATDCLNLVRALHVKGRGDVCILLTSRKSDWAQAGADILPWLSFSDVHEVPLHGLSEEDAQLLVTTWSGYGARGLGRLAGVQHEEAVRRLFTTAQREAAAEEGAFLGAMLSVRYGEALKQHVQQLLVGMLDQQIPGGRSLLDGLAYISAMHSENLLFLSKVVLAHALGCRESDIQPRVLRLLGKEAFVHRHSRFVLVRHRRVAEAVVEVLRDTFEYDIETVFVELMQAAIDARETSFVMNFSAWRFELPNHFLNRNPGLAVRLAQVALERDPTNASLVVNLAMLLRKAGQPEQAAVLFRDYHGKCGKRRNFYYEWGVTEGNLRHQAVSVWLDAISLSDEIRGETVGNDDAKMVLAGLGVALGELYEQYHERAFIEGRGAVAVLGLALRLDSTARGYFERHKSEANREGVRVTSQEDALHRITTALHAAWKRRESDLDGTLPALNELHFEGLTRLLRDAAVRQLRTR